MINDPLCAFPCVFCFSIWNEDEIRRSTPRSAKVCVWTHSKNKQTVIGIFKVKEVKNLDSGGSYNIQDLDHELF